ncbi:MAG TPA: gluconate 2-dehydrogenase subunit 3 family protein [Bryobacteraceae bacterium]|nr:gluconate 2-dehydrogenase subunit 3 family protein [Bryobacteraceae bacterium]
MSETDHEISRRELIVSSAFVPLAALTASAQNAETALTPAQIKTLAAFVERLIPGDELGPSAAEAGAHVYIDRALAGPNAGEKQAFVEGLASLDAFAKSSQDAAFADLPPEKRDALIAAMERGTAAGFTNAPQFFSRLRRLTLEGMFGDPYYGGNRNFAGWDLIRYPGPRLAVSADEQRMDKLPAPNRRSAYGPQYGR